MSDSAHKIWVTVDGERYLVEIEDLQGQPIIAIVDGARYEIELDDLLPDLDTTSSTPVKHRADPSTHSAPGDTASEVTSPMPGDIVQILVNPGQVVQAGDPMCILDAMKMKNTVHAPQAGTIAEICVQEGQSVEYGTKLFQIN
ncbi:MAG: biotin/lipoyl-containing protein [Anaerolineales bacterium]